MRIETFYSALTQEGEEEANTILQVLRRLTEVQDSRDLARDEPAPLGAWGGWS